MQYKVIKYKNLDSETVILCNNNLASPYGHNDCDHKWVAIQEEAFHLHDLLYTHVHCKKINSHFKLIIG